MFELIIIWDTGDKDIYTYETQEEAEVIAQGYAPLSVVKSHGRV